MRNMSMEPTMAANTAGMPKRRATRESICLPVSSNLKMLLKKCTTPVSAMANSVGKNIIQTGVRMVPSPKPEKKVSMETPKATKDKISMSISDDFEPRPLRAHSFHPCDHNFINALPVFVYHFQLEVIQHHFIAYVWQSMEFGEHQACHRQKLPIVLVFNV